MENAIQEIKNEIFLMDNLNNTKLKQITSYIDESNIKLTLKQRKFCFYYVMNDQNGVDAVKRAGYSEKGIYVRVCVLLRDDKIQQAIQLIIKNEMKVDKNILEYNIFKKLMSIINSDILDYVDEEGNLKKKLSDIPKHLRQCIKKIEPKRYGKDGDNKVLTFEIMGKEWAIEKLMNYISMIKEKSGDVNIVTEELKMNLLAILHGERVK